MANSKIIESAIQHVDVHGFLPSAHVFSVLDVIETNHLGISKASFTDSIGHVEDEDTSGHFVKRTCAGIPVDIPRTLEFGYVRSSHNESIALRAMLCKQHLMVGPTLAQLNLKEDVSTQRSADRSRPPRMFVHLTQASCRCWCG